ncbi:hypothetical protein [Rhizorhabdus sp. FW153]|uniref:hypothetical protein n=1 Tax=Rhizorhabdus sp. FW153 TaxID=3400216 RepID=UPI003CE7A2D8
MLRSIVLLPLLLAAAPALAVTTSVDPTAQPQAAAAERLYPEMEIEGEGWRGLLPIMLMNADLSSRPQSAETVTPGDSVR